MISRRVGAVPLWLFLLIAALGLAARVVGNEWGFLHAETYRSFGLELPDDIPDSRILGYYVHDEHSFTNFLDYTEHLRRTWDELRTGNLPLWQVPWQLYRGAVVPEVMAATPLAPMIFSSLGIVVTVVLGGLGLGDTDWFTLVTHTYRYGRWATAFFAVAAMWPLALIFDRLRFGYRLQVVGLLLFALQPGAVATSHWMGYNPLSVALHLTAFVLLLKTYDRQSTRSEILVRRWLGVGAWLGLCLANKLTVLPLFPVVAVAAVESLWRGRFAAGNRKLDLRHLGPVAAVGALLLVAIAAVYLFFVTPGLLQGEIKGFRVQHQMVVGDTLADETGRLSRTWTYLTETLAVSIGVYPLLLGCVGLGLWLRNAAKGPIEPRLLLVWITFLVVGYTSNDLGLMPGRSLGVGALWLLPTLAVLDRLGGRRPGAAAAVAGLCVLSYALSAVFLDRYFVLETDGYRTRASRFVLAQVPRGEIFLLEHDSKYHHLDLSLAARKLSPDLHPYDFRFHAAPEPLPEPSWGAYWPDTPVPASAELLATFSPCCLVQGQEPEVQTWLRRLAGQPRLDALIFKAPGLKVYRFETAKPRGDELHP